MAVVIVNVLVIIASIVVVVLVIGSLACKVFDVISRSTRGRTRQSRNRLGRSARDTSRAIDSDYREARQAMNDAAGQSWRNGFE